MAYQFDGTSDYLSTTSPLLTSSSDFTCTGFVTFNSDVDNTVDVVVSNWASSSDFQNVLVTRGDLASDPVQSNDEGSAIQLVGFTAGTWHQYVYQSADSSRESWIDGTNSADDSGAPTLGAAPTTSSIGARGDASNKFDGSVGVVAYWDGVEADDSICLEMSLGRDPRTVATFPTNLILLRGAAIDVIAGTTWTENGSPTVVGEKPLGW